MLTSGIHHPTREQGPSPQACWDFPTLQMALKPWEAAGKRLGQTGGVWVRDALGAGRRFSSAWLLSYPEVWAAGQQDALSDGEIQTIPILPPNQGAAGGASTLRACLPPGPGSAQPPRQHLIACYSVILMRVVSCWCGSLLEHFSAWTPGIRDRIELKGTIEWENSFPLGKDS